MENENLLYLFFKLIKKLEIYSNGDQFIDTECSENISRKFGKWLIYKYVVMVEMCEDVRMEAIINNTI